MGLSPGHAALQRLVEVRKEGRRRLEPKTLAVFACEWVDARDDEAELKYSTRQGYRQIINRHLIPALGRLQLERVDGDDLERYKVAKRKAGLAPRTVNRHLNLLHELYVAAVKRRLVRGNPVDAVDRPKERRRHWRILTPLEVGRVARAFTELGADPWTTQARVVFLTVIGAGLRRGEILGLRWRDVTLADPEGATLHVRETFVRGRVETPKSEAGRRTIALGAVLADELFQHMERTAFSADGERVFCHPTKGTPLDPGRYAETLRKALERAGIDDPVRPFQDGRHTSITNAAAAGTPPAALMARAGHSDFSTTQGYIDLAGEVFRGEADRLEERVFASVGSKSGQN